MANPDAVPSSPDLQQRLVLYTAETLHRHATAYLASAQDSDGYATLLGHVHELGPLVENAEAVIVHAARSAKEPWSALAEPLAITPERLRKRWKSLTLHRRVERIRAQQAAGITAARDRGRERAAVLPDPEAVQAVLVDAEHSLPHTPAQQLASALSFLQRSTRRTLADTAADIGISASHLSRVLAGGRRPSWPVMLNFAQVCGGHVPELRDLWEAAQRPADHGATVRPLAPHSQPAAREKFHITLRALYLAARLPEYATLHAAVGGLLGEDQIADILAGHYLPDWPRTSQLILALNGRPGELKPLWHAATNPPRPYPPLHATS
ncbi:helix-turn-helix transcriptional regulator [Streptomyces sp. NPDC047718]|uniref:helix-turn-helix domain-containing protein n=1 Tax=Streptomyces sp. NPDC047718 TaxID=3155479 RepID=UPI0033F7AFD4